MLARFILLLAFNILSLSTIPSSTYLFSTFQNEHCPNIYIVVLYYASENRHHSFISKNLDDEKMKKTKMNFVGKLKNKKDDDLGGVRQQHKITPQDRREFTV